MRSRRERLDASLVNVEAGTVSANLKMPNIGHDLIRKALPDKASRVHLSEQHKLTLILVLGARVTPLCSLDRPGIAFNDWHGLDSVASILHDAPLTQRIQCLMLVPSPSLDAQYCWVGGIIAVFVHFILLVLVQPLQCKKRLSITLAVFLVQSLTICSIKVFKT